MSKITKELLDEIEERANDAAKIYGDTWDSALVGDPSGKFHAITSEHTNDVVARAADDSRESSWLCDYLESVSPAAILELVKIARAAEKLVRCKGRYHSEQNYRALAALFGVTVPDLPPLEGEQEPVADVVAWRKEGEERTCDIRWRRHDVAPGPLYAVPQAPEVPAGYVLVPIEPTEAMMLNETSCQHHAWDDPDCSMRQTRRFIWKHMVEAAPKINQQ